VASDTSDDTAKFLPAFAPVLVSTPASPSSQPQYFQSEPLHASATWRLNREDGLKSRRERESDQDEHSVDGDDENMDECERHYSDHSQEPNSGQNYAGASDEDIDGRLEDEESNSGSDSDDDTLSDGHNYMQVESHQYWWEDSGRNRPARWGRRRKEKAGTAK
jgi:hypothetical protein